MSDKSHVGMGFSVCPVCGCKHDEVVLLDQRLRNSLERENFMGWDLCKEHASMAEEYIALVEVVPPKTGDVTLENANRTGQVAHVRRKVAKGLLGIDLPATAPLAFVEDGYIAKLQASTQCSA